MWLPRACHDATDNLTSHPIGMCRREAQPRLVWGLFPQFLRIPQGYDKANAVIHADSSINVTRSLAIYNCSG